MNLRAVLALLLALLPGVAFAQATGVFVPGHALMATTVTGAPYADAGGSAGSSIFGAEYLTEIGITNTGTPFCINDALVNDPNGYHQFCLGANALGGGLISYNAYGGATPLPLQLIINGGPNVIPGTVTGVPLAATNAALQALSTVTYSSVQRVGFYGRGDIPPMMYTASTVACTLNAGAGDNATQVSSVDGKCWLASYDMATGLSAQQFGALCNGSTDDSAAMATWWAAMAYVSHLTVPGPCIYKTALVSPNANLAGVTIDGAGLGNVAGIAPGGPALIYAGATTTGDQLYLGPTAGSTNQYSNFKVTGFQITSTTQMASGAGLHLYKVVESQVDPVIDGVGGNGKFFNGYWCDECSNIDVPTVQMSGASNDILLVNGSRLTDPWWPNYTGEMHLGKGYIASTAGQQAALTYALNGIHIAGGVGGFTIDAVDTLLNQHNLTIDKAITTTGNQGIFVGATAFFDQSSHDDIVINDNSSNTQWQGGAKLIEFNGWIASGGVLNGGDVNANCVNVQSFAGGTIKFRGGEVLLCERDGIYVQDATANVIVSGETSIRLAGRYSIESSVTKPAIQLNSPRFSINGTQSSTLGDFDPNVLTSTLDLYAGPYSWSPVLKFGGSTAGITQLAFGQYSLRGRSVIGSFVLSLSAVPAVTNVEADIFGLPVVATTSIATTFGGTVNNISNMQSLPGGVVPAIGAGTQYILPRSSNASGSANLQDGNFTSASFMQGTFSYER